MRNASGQFIDRYGGVLTTSKTISPETPLDSIRLDGKTNRFYISQLTAKMTRPLDVVFENGEVMPLWTSQGLTLDPTVNAVYSAGGYSSWNDYMGFAMNRISSAYISEFKTLPSLNNTRILHYQINGHPQYSWNYARTRTLNSIANGQHYSSGDIYMQIPSNWRYWVGAAHGWQFLVESRFEEIRQGDKLFGPTVSPGWNINEESTPRPAQWLRQESSAR